MSSQSFFRAVCGLGIMLWVGGAASGETFTGSVSDVIQGDMLIVVHDGKTDTVHLVGVDCPELAQPFGPEAKKFTTEAALNKEVTVEGEGADEEGHALAKVTLPDSSDLAKNLLSAGLGWFYEKYPGADSSYAGAAAKAITGKLGLWAGAAPLAPWDYRADAAKKNTGKNAAQAKSDVKDEAKSKDADVPNEVVYISRNGSEYHKLGCVQLFKESKPLMRKEAEKLKYSACTKCFPPKAGDEAPELSGKGTPPPEPEPTAPPPKAAPPTLPPAMASKPAPTQSEIEKIKQDPIYQQIQPTWVKDSSGNVLGLTTKNLAGTPYAAPAAMLGFKDGDILQSVNGERVDSEQKAAELVHKLKDASSVTVTIIRDGQPQNVTIPIPR